MKETFRPHLLIWLTESATAHTWSDKTRSGSCSSRKASQRTLLSGLQMENWGGTQTPKCHMSDQFPYSLGSIWVLWVLFWLTLLTANATSYSSCKNGTRKTKSPEQESWSGKQSLRDGFQGGNMEWGVGALHLHSHLPALTAGLMPSRNVSQRLPDRLAATFPSLLPPWLLPHFPFR